MARKPGKTADKKKLAEELEDGLQILQDRNKVNSKPAGTNEIRVDVKCKTENQKKFLKLIRDNEITICSGFAGTGKTFLAAAEALNLLKSKDTPYRKIVLLKSVTTLKGEDVGFLKGDLEDKLAPFMFSFMANFYKITGKGVSDKLKGHGIIDVLPIAFIRGMSIDNSIIIVDEAQNISQENMKSIMTRIGENSKMIIIGDTKQIDIKNKKESSLLMISEKFKDIPGFGVMHFEKKDQVRNPLIDKIEDVFDSI